MLEATSDDMVQAMRLLDDVIIVAHPHPDDWALEESFKAVAQEYRDRYTFIAKSSSQQTKSRLECFNNVDDERKETTETGKVNAVENFVKKCGEPLIPELTRRNERMYTGVCNPYPHTWLSVPLFLADTTTT